MKKLNHRRYIAKLKSENDNLEELLEKLKESLNEYNNEKIKNILKLIVPTYKEPK